MLLPDQEQREKVRHPLTTAAAEQLLCVLQLRTLDRPKEPPDCDTQELHASLPLLPQALQERLHPETQGEVEVLACTALEDAAHEE